MVVWQHKNERNQDTEKHINVQFLRTIQDKRVQQDTKGYGVERKGLGRN